VKCPQCVGAGERSQVDIGPTQKMTIGNARRFYDEDGKWHFHDSQPTRHTYNCSRGHRWFVDKFEKCPNCDFGKGDA
jgi:hypothetical protein